MDNEFLTDDKQNFDLEESAVKRPERHHSRGERSDRFFMIRNILNIIFMIGAVVGVLVLYFHDKTIGTVIILVSMVFKMVECCFRLMPGRTATYPLWVFKMAEYVFRLIRQ